MKALTLAVSSFVGAGLLAVLLPSTWRLLVARILLICLGIAVVVIGLRQRQRRDGNS
jgi:putative Mn2+ efflux pump MntP